MQKKGELVSYRPDIKVVDCTLRDGGIVNDFKFDDEFVKDLYKANIAAGVDYMEFGYKASKEIFNVEDFGKWKFCDEESIREIVGDNDTDLKIAVMADVGRTDYKKDIIPKKDSVIDMIRVATYVNTIPAAIEMINYCADLGYEVTINIMAVSTASEKDLDLALDMLGQSKASVIYLVDSYGSLYPEQIREFAKKYLKVAEKYGKSIGIHAHNNQQLAFANTIESCVMGVSYLEEPSSSMAHIIPADSTPLNLPFLILIPFSGRGPPSCPPATRPPSNTTGTFCPFEPTGILDAPVTICTVSFPTLT